MGTDAMACESRSEDSFHELLLHRGFWELNPGCQVFLPTEPFFHPDMTYFQSSFFCIYSASCRNAFWVTMLICLYYNNIIKVFLGAEAWTWCWTQSILAVSLTLRKNDLKAAVNELYLSFKVRIMYTSPSIKKASKWFITYWICLIWGNLGWNALLLRMESKLKQYKITQQDIHKEMCNSWLSGIENPRYNIILFLVPHESYTIQCVSCN